MTTSRRQTTRAGSVPRTDRRLAYDLRAAELTAWEALLRSLTAQDWHRPTVCTEWDVADIVGHLLGQAEEVRRPWLFLLRDRRGKRAYPEVVGADAHMLVQADDYRGTAPDELADAFPRQWARTNRALRRMPGLVRRLRIDSGGVPGLPKIPIDWLQDVVLLRDLWMHREDICQATGRAFVVGAHDREVVEQVLRDLDGVWTGPAVVLELTGDAGGGWQLGLGDPVAIVRVDAVAYMRTVSGRDDGPDLELVSGDPDAVAQLAAVRYPF